MLLKTVVKPCYVDNLFVFPNGSYISIFGLRWVNFELAAVTYLTNDHCVLVLRPIPFNKIIEMQFTPEHFFF